MSVVTWLSCFASEVASPPTDDPPISPDLSTKIQSEFPHVRDPFTSLTIDIEDVADRVVAVLFGDHE